MQDHTNCALVFIRVVVENDREYEQYIAPKLNDFADDLQKSIVLTIICLNTDYFLLLTGRTCHPMP